MSKSVFITGAGAGIGRATALAFAARGYTVGAYDIDDAGLQALADTIRATGGTVLTGHLDVTDYDEMASRVTEFAQANGNRLDVMVNNAGILASGPFQEIDVAVSHKEIDVNCKGVVNGLYAAFPYLRSTPSAVAVNLASASAIYGQAELAIYSSTKFFVRGLTEALDIEWERYGIRVIAMWPLFVKTAMTDDMDIGTSNTLGIRLSAQDVAEAIVSAVDAAGTRKKLRQVHFPVGVMAKVMHAASHLAPAPLNRLVNKRLSKM